MRKDGRMEEGRKMEVEIKEKVEGGRKGEKKK